MRAHNIRGCEGHTIGYTIDGDDAHRTESDTPPQIALAMARLGQTSILQSKALKAQAYKRAALGRSTALPQEMPCRVSAPCGPSSIRIGHAYLPPHRPPAPRPRLPGGCAALLLFAAMSWFSIWRKLTTTVTSQVDISMVAALLKAHIWYCVKERRASTHDKWIPVPRFSS